MLQNCPKLCCEIVPCKPLRKQVNLTQARDLIKNQHLVSGELKKKCVISMSLQLEPVIWSHDTGQNHVLAGINRP